MLFVSFKYHMLELILWVPFLVLFSGNWVLMLTLWFCVICSDWRNVQVIMFVPAIEVYYYGLPVLMLGVLNWSPWLKLGSFCTDLKPPQWGDSAWVVARRKLKFRFLEINFHIFACIITICLLLYFGLELNNVFHYFIFTALTLS